MRKHRWALVLAAALVAAGATGLPAGREMEGRQLVSALALDGRGTVTATAVTAVRLSDGESPEVYSGTGSSAAGACQALRENSSRRTYLGQTEQLLIGEGADLAAVLDFVLQDRDLRLDTLIYIVEGDAGIGLAASADKTSAETGGEDPRARTVGETLARLSQGEYALVPALAPGEDGRLAPSGWAVLGPDGMEGLLTGLAAEGADLLCGVWELKVAELPGGAVRLTGLSLRAAGGTVVCTLRGTALEGSPEAGELEAWCGARIRAALDAGRDGWGLDRAMCLSAPWRWAEVRKTPPDQWKVAVTGKVERGRV